MRQARGQAILEFALLLPLLFLIILNVVNFGGWFYSWITVTHATRAAAQLATMSSAYVGYGSSKGLQTSASLSDITNLVTDCANTPKGDVCSLPNPATVNITVCSNNSSSGTATPQAPETCVSPVADPQPNTSVIATVRVAYRYCPFIPFWEFPRLGVHLTIPACGKDGNGNQTGGWMVQRTAAMRMIQ